MLKNDYNLILKNVYLISKNDYLIFKKSGLLFNIKEIFFYIKKYGENLTLKIGKLAPPTGDKEKTNRCRS